VLGDGAAMLRLRYAITHFAPNHVDDIFSLKIYFLKLTLAKKAAMKKFLSGLVLAILALPVSAQESFAVEGPLCCTLRYVEQAMSVLLFRPAMLVSDDNGWGEYPKLIPAGTAVRITPVPGEPRNFHIHASGVSIKFINDSNRTLTLEQLARRFIAAPEQVALLQSSTPEVREAIAQGRASVGMDRQQVRMALGFPLPLENPTAETSRLLNYYWGDWGTFKVLFDRQGKVMQLQGIPVVLDVMQFPKPEK
jgi:hypothetical protein